MILAGRYSIDLHPQIIPGSLAGNGVGVSMFITPIRREKLSDQMVEQECCAEFRRSRIKAPRASTLANRVPGPHRVRIDPVHQSGRDTNSTLTARQPYPVVFREAERLPGRPIDEQPIVTEDLS